MGGFFGAIGNCDIISDVFFGTDYHSHLGTRRAGMAAYNKTDGLQRVIHNIENSPFRTKFEDVFDEMSGEACIGVISDYDPQPLLIRSKFSTYAICVIGIVNNAKQLISDYLNDNNGHFTAMTGGGINTTEVVAALINQKDSFVEGISFVQGKIEGSATILILTEGGTIIAARDKLGRLPVLVGKSEDGFCVSLESFAYEKLGYAPFKELKSGEIVELSAKDCTVLKEGRDEMRICSFLWSYYGYPTSDYEGVNVEIMRTKNGEIMAENDRNSNTVPEVDCVAGIPDSGVPHAIGYANNCHLPYARPFIKYTPTWSRSFTPRNQRERSKVAKMKQIPVPDLIKDKKLLLVDDSIVRGTQLKETTEFLYSNGAKEVHIRSACPPIMYSCKYLNFTRATSHMELIARRAIVEIEGEEGFNFIEEYSNPSTERGKKLRDTICKNLNFTSLEFQSLEGIIKAIGIEPCKLCTYCWSGKE